MEHKNKTHTSITLDSELLEWIDKEVKKKRFATRNPCDRVRHSEAYRGGRRQ